MYGAMPRSISSSIFPMYINLCWAKTDEINDRKTKMKRIFFKVPPLM
jgi:hypothetical protein